MDQTLLFYTLLVALPLCASLGYLFWRMRRALDQEIAARARMGFYIKSLEQRFGLSDSPAAEPARCAYKSCAAVDRNTDKTEALARLAGGLAHDLNNILSIIDGYTRLSLQNDMLPPMLSGYLDKVEAATQRGARLSNKMTVFSRHRIQTNSSIDLPTFLKTYAQRYLSKLPPSVTLKLLPYDLPLPLDTHSDALPQIMDALLENACDFMPKGGTIEISLAQVSIEDVPAGRFKESPVTRLRIRDEGIGIPTRDLRSIFDPFFTTQADKNRSGLGLSIVHGLVKQLGGSVFVNSTPGKGTCFDLYFPEGSQAGQRNAQTTDLSDPSTLHMQGYTVLAVDDESDILHILKPMLEAMGLHVLLAAHAHDALKLNDEYQGRIDLLLTDIAMPDMNGIKLSQTITAARPEIKTVYMSGFPGRGDIANCKIPDEATFLTKPLHYEDLALVLYCQLTGQNLSGKHLAAGQWTNAGHA